MNVREFVDGLKGGVLREADVYKYLKDVDARALQALYDNVYIAALACIGVHGYDSDNMFRAASIIAKYAKSEYSLSVGYGEPDYTEPSKEEPQRDRMGVVLPDELNNEAAKEYFAKAIEVGLMNGEYKWLVGEEDLAYFCSQMSTMLEMSNRMYNGKYVVAWQPFVALFNRDSKAMATNLSTLNKEGRKSANADVIDRLFAE